MPTQKQYQLLGVSSKSTVHEIKQAYRRLPLSSHPDKFNNDPRKEEQFKSISEAYGEVLAIAENESKHIRQIRLLEQPIHQEMRLKGRFPKRIYLIRSYVL